MTEHQIVVRTESHMTYVLRSEVTQININLEKLLWFGFPIQTGMWTPLLFDEIKDFRMVDPKLKAMKHP